MKLTAILVAVGVACVQPAAAQTASVGFLPMPTTMPTLLFAPDPLAGTLLRPFNVPVAADSPLVTGAVVASTEPPPVESPAGELEPLPAPAPSPAPAPAVEVPSSDAPAETVAAPPAEAPPPPPAPTMGLVRVIVENVEVATGNVNVALCNKSLSREGCPYVREVHAQQGFIEADFNDIPPGTYAVVGYHDVNGNSEFDKFMGVPREPYALSAAAANKLVPSFQDASLTINPGENAIVIRLKRLGG